MKVLLTIAKLYRTYKPLGFFGTLAFALTMIAAILFAPIVVTFAKTGEVPRFPTLIGCGFILMSAIQAFFSGMILQTISQKNRQDFEMELHRIRVQFDEMR